MKRFRNFRELFFYCLGGGSGAIINWTLTYTSVSIIGLNYTWGIVIGSFANLTYNFLFHRSLTFGVKDHFVKRAATYYIFGIILFFISIEIAFFCKKNLGLNYMVAQIIATIVSVFINFFASKYIVFAKKNC